MPLPASVQEIADVIGKERALFLVGRLPPSGSRSWRRVLYVPRRLHRAHPLVELVGPDDAEKLRAAFGGEILHLAQCRCVEAAWRTRCIAWLEGEGLNSAEIAVFLEVLPDTVRKTLASLRRGRGAAKRTPREIERLRAEGLTHSAIGARAGYSVSTVSRTLAAARAPSPGGAPRTFAKAASKAASTRAATLASLRAQIEDIKARAANRRDATARGIGGGNRP